MTNIQDRMKWYNDTFKPEECVQEKFDFTDLYRNILERFENKSNDFFMSFLKKECKCKDLEECECDSEEYERITNKQMNIHSNCKASFEFEIEKKIKSQFRVFYLTQEDEEIPLLDIYKKHIIIYMDDKKIKFTNEDKLKIRKNNSYVKFDYMSFNHLN